MPSFKLPKGDPGSLPLPTAVSKKGDKEIKKYQIEQIGKMIATADFDYAGAVKSRPGATFT